MRLVASAAVVMGAFFIATSNSPTAHAAPSSARATSQSHVVSETQKPKPKMATVKHGDYLAKIAKAHDTTYLRLFYANTQINDPDLIYPGQKLRVPTKLEKLKPRALAGAAPVKRVQNSSSATSTSAKPTRSTYKPATNTVSVSVSGSVWDRLAQCEAGGNWSINTGNGYYGGLQFTLSSWRGVGGGGYPHQASKSEQIARAKMLLASQGWNAWPACSAKLSLR